MFMNDKKGQGISINVIIIAAIALLVLVILSVLLIRSGTTLVTDCADVNGQCLDSCDGEFMSQHRTARCEGEPVCCVSVVNSDSDESDTLAS